MKALTTGRGTMRVKMSRMRSDTRYALDIASPLGQYCINSCREPQFAETWVPQANTKARKKLMDQTIIAPIRAAVVTSNKDRLDTTKRRRQKRTMLNLMNPYAADVSRFAANSIC